LKNVYIFHIDKFILAFRLQSLQNYAHNFIQFEWKFVAQMGALLRDKSTHG